MEAALHGRAQQEHGRGRAVIGAPAGVLAQPAAELGEDQDRHPAAVAGTVEVAQERPEPSRRARVAAARARSSCSAWVSKPPSWV